MSDIIIVDDESSVLINNEVEQRVVETDNSTVVVSTSVETNVIE